MGLIDDIFEFLGRVQLLVAGDAFSPVVGSLR